VVLIYLAFLIIRSSLKGNKEAKNLLIGFIPFFISTILDVILPTVFDIDNYIYLTAYGFTFFLISIAGVLANRFVNFRNEAEDLNINLEKKVNKRTEQLENANMELKNTNQQLQHARNIAERDMEIAVNVQSSFLINNPPKSENWDTAFYFRPMAGISGDIYDFYQEGNKTVGAGIFDVSGHGIASGLITLLAKSIISRQFVEMKNSGLNEIMKSANIKLTKEIGKSDIYLTGILLRLKQNVVEYVNAGHSDLIYKKASTGNVHLVKLKGDRDYKGMFLGLEGVNSEYPPIKFKIKKDDVLLLYTDCFYEATNEKGEEYDISRIIKSLRDAPDSDSKTIMKKLVDDFFEFVGSNQLKDDLTILLLKRK
jgi:sigma-B regulation protein RsbU (phosphoserine phosphatase)